MLKSKKSIFSLIVFFAFIGACFIYQPVWHKISDTLNLPAFFRKDWRLGLDLEGGARLTYEIDLSLTERADRESTVAGLREVIERRINLFGVREPEIYVARKDESFRLIVELSGERDFSEAIREIGQTPFLEFREMQETLENELENEEPRNEFIPTELTGRYVKRAMVEADQMTARPIINIEFTEEGAKIFEDLTARNVGKPLGIFLDGEPIEIPIVREKISGGRAQISGDFTIETARQFVKRFNAGALPAPIELVNQEQIGAALGRGSLEKMFKGGLAGLALIMIFMIIYYKKLGLAACLALTIYIILVLSIFKVIPVTLTLAGIAGFILSIGMAVDANVLIFERIKEERKKGLKEAMALDQGFKRTWLSIRDANITTILIALILFYFTTGFIKGFGLTLFIGVSLSMFSAIFITRTILELFQPAENKI